MRSGRSVCEEARRRERLERTDINLYLDINETGGKNRAWSFARGCGDAPGTEHTVNLVRSVIYEPIQIVHTRFVRKVRAAEILKRANLHEESP